MKRLMRFFSMFWCIVLIVTTTSVCQVEATETTWKAPIGASGIDWNTWKWSNLQFPQEIMDKIESIDFCYPNGNATIYCEITIITKGTYDYTTAEQIWSYIDTLLRIRSSEIGIIPPPIYPHAWGVPKHGHENEMPYIYMIPDNVTIGFNYPKTIYGNLVWRSNAFLDDLYYYNGKRIQLSLVEALSDMYITAYNGLVETTSIPYTWTPNGVVKGAYTTFINSDLGGVSVPYDTFMQLVAQGIIKMYDLPFAERDDFEGDYDGVYDGFPNAVFVDGKVHSDSEF